VTTSGSTIVVIRRRGLRWFDLSPVTVYSKENGQRVPPCGFLNYRGKQSAGQSYSHQVDFELKIGRSALPPRPADHLPRDPVGMQQLCLITHTTKAPSPQDRGLIIHQHVNIQPRR
jgi:hypothetical protein